MISTEQKIYLESTCIKITLAGSERARTAETFEVEAPIIAERAYGEVVPVKATNLPRVAVVITVTGTVKSRGIKPSLIVMSVSNLESL